MYKQFAIFLSHAGADKAVARKIRDRLSQVGIPAWLDEAEIQVGESIPEKVADGIASSAALCLLISKYSASSEWVQREMNAFLHSAITEKSLILPCRLDDTEMPVLIRDIKYADFSQDFETGIKSVLRALPKIKKIDWHTGIKGRFGTTSGRPFIDVMLTIPALKIRGPVSFLVDTGADMSMLSTADARRLSLNYEACDKIALVGLGGPNVCAVVPAILAMSDQEVALHAWEVSLLVGAQNGDEHMPSILGRDVLNKLRITFDSSAGLLRAEVVSSSHTFPLV